MTINNFIYKVKRKLKHTAEFVFFQYPRVIKYRLLSSCKNIIGNPKYNQPTQLLGGGVIMFGKNVNLGVRPSPNLYSGYGYIDARKEKSLITIGDNVWINNNFMITSEGQSISIGKDTLIGLNVEITDSDFHDLNPKKRMSGIPKTAKVIIEENVFIGNNVKILKGVTIGKNSVIGNSSVVTKSIPSNVIAGGYPCKVIKTFDFN
jgi:acetyltransferase-like isoleucine patch superfamily enzyme